MQVEGIYPQQVFLRKTETASQVKKMVGCKAVEDHW